MAPKNKSELVRQIEAYGLKGKLADLARKEESKRPFHHLPKQFSKGILIGNIAIVPKKSIPTNILELDTKFASQLFNIQSSKRMIREAQKDNDEVKEDVYWDRLDSANHLADECKGRIQQIFNDTFGA